MSKDNNIKDWVRLAAKLGMLFTEPKVRSAIGSKIKSGVDDLTDSVSSRYDEAAETVSSKYEDAVDRLGAAADALQGRTYWPTRVAGFLLGVGVGVGVGILLAPASGSETRESLRDRAVDMKNRVFESAEAATGTARQTVRSMPGTGTQG